MSTAFDTSAVKSNFISYIRPLVITASIYIVLQLPRESSLFTNDVSFTSKTIVNETPSSFFRDFEVGMAQKESNLSSRSDDLGVRPLFHYNHTSISATSVNETILNETFFTNTTLRWSTQTELLSPATKSTLSFADKIPSDDFGAHLSFLRNQTSLQTQDEQVVLAYRGVSGLGHRLMRMAGMYHLTKALNLTHFHTSWGWECGPNQVGDPDIFDNLFGKGPLFVYPPSRPIFDSFSAWLTGNRNASRKVLRFINEVPAYFMTRAGQVDMAQSKNHGYYGKGESDAEFYAQLLSLFRFKGRIRDFTTKHAFVNHTVLGLHIRAGNGETGDFLSKARGIENLHSWLQSLAKLLGEYSRSFSKPALIFLATDTVDIVETFSNATFSYGIRVVLFEQNHVPKGKGVSFQYQWQKDDDVNGTNECHRAWENQFTDMYLLSTCDVVVAARYSSFSQSLPLSILFARRRELATSDALNLFCEVVKRGDGMHCFDSYLNWMVRDQPRYFGNGESRNRPHRHNEVTLPSTTVLQDLEQAFNNTAVYIQIGKTS